MARLISGGARIYFGGQRSAISQQRNRLRIIAKKAEDQTTAHCTTLPVTFFSASSMNPDSTTK
eukprot:7963409-Pyramimonas_sp.AAC.1